MKKWILLSVLFLVAGAIVGKLAAQSTSKPNPPPAASAAAHGRFQIVMRDGVRADTFLLDTETGRVWSRVQYTNIKGTPDVWALEPRIDDRAQARA